MVKHGNLIPTYIEARSPQGLRALMVKTNTKHRGMVKFFDIQTYKKRNTLYWICWFYVDMKEVLNGPEEI